MILSRSRIFLNVEGGAGGGSTVPPPNPGTGAIDNTPWYQKSGVSAEHHEWLAQKQFADPSIAIASHRALESLVGRQRLAVPNGPEDQAAYDALYKALGRPDKADDYKLKEGSKLKPDEVKPFLPILHKHGASPKLVEELLDAYEGRGTALITAREQQLIARENAEKEELATAWGTKHDANMDIAARAFRALGMDEETTSQIEEAIGYRKTMELFHKIGAGMSEASFHQDGKPGSHTGKGESLPELQAALSTKLADKDFRLRYNNHDPRVRAKAIEEVEDIQKKIAAHQEANPQVDPRLRGSGVSEAKFGSR